jgi:hypothetical protein
MDLKTEILREGYYQSNGVLIPISILRQNWDYYYEEEYDDDPPTLDDKGFAYYVIYGEYKDLLYADRSHTCRSIEEAVEVAENNSISRVEWNIS